MKYRSIWTAKVFDSQQQSCNVKSLIAVESLAYFEDYRSAVRSGFLGKIIQMTVSPTEFYQME